MGNNWERLEIHVQPFYGITKHKVVGAEALIRCKDDKNIGADDILEQLKEQGMLIEFDMEMLEKLCICMTNIENDISSSDCIIYKQPLNINISPETLNEKGISEKIISILNKHNIKDKVVLELNEGSLFGSKEVEENIDALTSAGISLSLDDFNMTDKGLMALSRYNVKEVKFKQTGLGEFTQKDLIILKHLNRMCVELKLHMVIEGIETQQQFDEVKSLGIDTIQGYLISRPIPLRRYTEESLRSINIK